MRKKGSTNQNRSKRLAGDDFSSADRAEPEPAKAIKKSPLVTGTQIRVGEYPHLPKQKMSFQSMSHPKTATHLISFTPAHQIFTKHGSISANLEVIMEHQHLHLLQVALALPSSEKKITNTKRIPPGSPVSRPHLLFALHLHRLREAVDGGEDLQRWKEENHRPPTL